MGMSFYKETGKSLLHILVGVTVLFFSLCGCSGTPAIPVDYDATGERPMLFPDYTGVTCPPDIAPMNFNVLNEGSRCVVAFFSGHRPAIVAGGRGTSVKFDAGKWRNMLAQHAGDSLRVEIYVECEGEWRRLAPFMLYVASEPIGSFLTYRLIEPGYIPYRRLGIYQRNLTNFEVQPVYENNVVDDVHEDHCINCHNYQNYGTDRMLFHVRENHGGTILVDGDSVMKVDFKIDSLPGGAVYPAWHPERPWIVFSTNHTGQAFHINHAERVEVVDMMSDLVFYDLERNTVRYVLHTDSVMETFPHWSPDGRKLYYTAAYVPEMVGLSASDRDVYSVENYKSLRYDVMAMEFNPQTGCFGEPVKVVACAESGKSASVARVSPDGRYVLYTLADYGQFNIWHKSADLWVHDLQTGTDYALKEANSRDAESYHSWSSNGRWIAFSSRRDDGCYTRVYIAYFDRNGRAHKAFMLPQENPEENILLLKSYNVPELTRERVNTASGRFEQTVLETAPVKVGFESGYCPSLQP